MRFPGVDWNPMKVQSMADNTHPIGKAKERICTGNTLKNS
jgi:hypothetical protein